MDFQKYSTEALKKKLQKYKERLEIQNQKDNEKFASLGFGTAMRGYSKLSKMSFKKADEIQNKIRELNSEIYRRSKVGEGYILSFKDFKYLAEWKEKPREWHIYWKGKHVCTQPKNDINIVEIAKWYNANFTQYKINFD